jgi:succinate dehydrogenase flavin-adding protein (antitoxin of CptAB toxin-antitoxin module)
MIYLKDYTKNMSQDLKEAFEDVIGREDRDLKRITSEEWVEVTNLIARALECCSTEDNSAIAVMLKDLQTT